MVETLMVATLFTVVAAVIITSLMSGMRLWDRAQRSAVSNSALLLVTESMSKELRQAIAHPAIPFEGNPQGFSFPSVLGTSVVKVAYAFDSSTGALTRTQIPLEGVLKEPKEESPKKELVTLEEFSLSYCVVNDEEGQVSWQDFWGADDGVFHAVRMKIKTADEECSEVFFVPIA